MSQVKVFAMYLPQYHETEVNSKFWGEGFTDWVSAKNAKPLFEKHLQPKAPINDFYYDLSKKEDILWQANLAKRYSVDGWGIYHYWFNSEQSALTKPAEIILKNSDIDIPFFFAWDNASWKRTWSKIRGNDWAPIADNKQDNRGPEILLEYQLGSQNDWKKHFEYLLPFFQDFRYIKENNRPIFVIYNYSEAIVPMIDCWNQWAVQQGFDGIKVIFSYNPFHGIPKTCNKFTYEPLFSGWGSVLERVVRKMRGTPQTAVKCYSYDRVWKKILRNARLCRDNNLYYGAFVNYDDTPRRGHRGKVIMNSTPDKFQEYLSRLISICERQSKNYIFLTAWNEWGEGAVLEPDKENGYGYLQAFQNAMRERVK